MIQVLGRVSPHARITSPKAWMTAHTTAGFEPGKRSVNLETLVGEERNCGGTWKDTHAEPTRAPHLASHPRLLVIGYGNALRGDDSAGPLAAEAIAALDIPGVTVEVRHQLVPELAEPISRASQVVFIDAASGLGHSEEEPLQAHALDPMAVGGTESSFLGHYQDPASLVALAGRLFGRHPRALLMTIAARSFELGAAPSAACARGIELAVERVTTLAAHAGRELREDSHA